MAGPGSNLGRPGTNVVPIRLSGAYVFSHDGFIRNDPPYPTNVPTLVAYLDDGKGNYEQQSGFTIEGAVGWMMFDGSGGVTGRVMFNKHGIGVPAQAADFEGTYTVNLTTGIDVVYTGTINTKGKNQTGPLVNYYFVAADNWRELRFLITDFQNDQNNAQTKRTFTATGTMRKV